MSSPRLYLAIVAAKLTASLVKLTRQGQGTAAPGLVALKIEPRLLELLFSRLKRGVVLISGTNGKTTTANILTSILKQAGFETVHNQAGSNLARGIASTLIARFSIFNFQSLTDFGVFEVDEAELVNVLPALKPKILILLNLFRDQLDRYGEIDVLLERWKKALAEVDWQLNLVLNADDPAIASLGTLNGFNPPRTSVPPGRRNGAGNKAPRSTWKVERGLETVYFGFSQSEMLAFAPEKETKQTSQACDSIYCLQCGGELDYQAFTFSHLGLWKCSRCQLQRPKPQLTKLPFKSNLQGAYNQYNLLAAVLAAQILGVGPRSVKLALARLQPAFGRNETLEINNKKAVIMLSKNPAGFNVNLEEIRNQKGKIQNILLALNDRIPDGKDVSWIWDVNFERLTAVRFQKIFVSGDRAEDLGLRLKYAFDNKCIIEPDLKKAIKKSLDQTAKGSKLYILPTYSAMLEVRKMLKGKKLL